MTTKALTLTKIAKPQWGGNHFGTDPAQWTVKGHEHVRLRGLGRDWIAIDTRDSSVLGIAHTRAQLLAHIAPKLA